MAVLGRTVRMHFLDGQERTFTQVYVDQESPGGCFSPGCKPAPFFPGCLRPWPDIGCRPCKAGNIWTRTQRVHRRGQEGVL